MYDIILESLGSLALSGKLDAVAGRRAFLTRLWHRWNLLGTKTPDFLLKLNGRRFQPNSRMYVTSKNWPKCMIDA